jgi:hypothetical protein
VDDDWNVTNEETHKMLRRKYSELCKEEVKGKLLARLAAGGFEMFF